MCAEGELCECLSVLSVRGEVVRSWKDKRSAKSAMSAGAPDPF